MKYCSRCGFKLKDDAVTCPRCGCMVEREPVEVVTAEPTRKVVNEPTKRVNLIPTVHSTSAVVIKKPRKKEPIYYGPMPASSAAAKTPVLIALIVLIVSVLILTVGILMVAMPAQIQKMIPAIASKYTLFETIILIAGAVLTLGGMIFTIIAFIKCDQDQQQGY